MDEEPGSPRVLLARMPLLTFEDRFPASVSLGLPMPSLLLPSLLFKSSWDMALWSPAGPPVLKELLVPFREFPPVFFLVGRTRLMATFVPRYSYVCKTEEQGCESSLIHLGNPSQAWYSYR